jgi:hypothetical protein
MAIGKERTLMCADHRYATLGCSESAFGSLVITGGFTVEL